MTRNVKRIIAIRLIETEYKCPHVPEPFPPSMKSIVPLHFQIHQKNWNTNICKLLSDPIQKTVAIYIFYAFINQSFPISRPPYHMSSSIKMPHAHFLKDIIYDSPNPFFSPSIKKEFERMVCKVQSTYHSFCKLARKWKLRKYEVQQTVDFYMNELSPKSKYTYQLIQERHVFYFSLTDLKQIILTALTATSGFFSMPTQIKNPYNGVPLTKADIYNIYFKMKDILFKMPHLFVLFYECELNINEFKRKNEGAILEYVVNQYIATSTNKTIMPETMRMVRAYDRTNVICLLDGEKIEKLVDFMRRPYFSLHLLKKYTFDNTKRHNIETELSWRMKRFISFYTHIGESTFFDKISLTDSREKLKKSLKKPHIEYEWLNNHKYEDTAYNRYVHYGGFLVGQPECMVFRPRSYGAIFREDIERELSETHIVWQAARDSYGENPPTVRRLLEFQINRINADLDTESSSLLSPNPVTPPNTQLENVEQTNVSAVQRQISLMHREINEILNRQNYYYAIFHPRILPEEQLEAAESDSDSDYDSSADPYSDYSNSDHDDSSDIE